MRRLLAASLVLLVSSGTAFAQDKNWKKTLEQKLKDTYPPSKLALMDASKVNTLGAVLTILKAGIVADPAERVVYHRARVRNGELVSDNRGSSSKLLTFLLPSPAAGDDTYVLSVGAKVYIRTLSVSDENIDIHIYTMDPFEHPAGGATKSSRYTAMVRFEFPKGYLAAAPFDDLGKAIGAVLATDAQALASNIQLDPKPAPVTAVALATPNAAVQQSPPPDPAGSAPTAPPAEPATIGIGQTVDQVTAALGPPLTIVKLGTKEIYVYKDLKITFLNGRISEVE